MYKSVTTKIGIDQLAFALYYEASCEYGALSIEERKANFDSANSITRAKWIAKAKFLKTLLELGPIPKTIHQITFITIPNSYPETYRTACVCGWQSEWKQEYLGTALQRYNEHLEKESTGMA